MPFSKADRLFYERKTPLSGRAKIDSLFRGSKLALDLVAPIELIRRRSYSEPVPSEAEGSGIHD